MTKPLVSPYRMLSFAAIAATGVLVACAPDDGELLESAVATCVQTGAVCTPAAAVAPAARAPGPLI